MTIPIVNNCCCISLRTAGIVIGVLGFLMNATYALRYLAMINDIYRNSLSQLDIALLAVALFGAVFNGLWICGILNDNAGKMEPLIIYSFLISFLMVISPFIALFFLSTSNVDPAMGTAIFFLLGFAAILVCYVWVVQYSLYKEMKRQASQNESMAPRRTPIPPASIRSYETSRRYYAQTTEFSPEPCAPSYIDVFEPEPIFYMPEPDPDAGFLHGSPPDYDLQVHLDVSKMDADYCDATGRFRSETCIATSLENNDCQMSCEQSSQSYETAPQSNSSEPQCYEPD